MRTEQFTHLFERQITYASFSLTVFKRMSFLAVLSFHFLVYFDKTTLILVGVLAITLSEFNLNFNF